MLGIQKILFATDLGNNSLRALEHAKLFVSRFDSELHAFHVLEDIPTNTPAFGGGLALNTYVHENPSTVEQKIHHLFDPTWLLGKHLIVATSDGEPGNQIVRYAREKSIDIIILGTHGRTGLAHVLTGSVAEYVARHSKCAVLIVPSRES